MSSCPSWTLRSLAISTLRHQFTANGQIAGLVRVLLRAQDMASLRDCRPLPKVDLRHMGTGRQHSLRTETLCRWTGLVGRSSRSQTTLSRMSPNGLSASLKLTAGTSLRCVRRAPLKHLSKLLSELRPRPRTVISWVSPTHRVRAEPQPLNTCVRISRRGRHLQQRHRLPAGEPLLILSPTSPASPFCRHSRPRLWWWGRALQRIRSLDAVPPRHLLSGWSSRRRSLRLRSRPVTRSWSRRTRPYRYRRPLHRQPVPDRRSCTGPPRLLIVQPRRCPKSRQQPDRCPKPVGWNRFGRPHQTLRRRPSEQGRDKLSRPLPQPSYGGASRSGGPCTMRCRRSSSIG